MKVEYSYYKDNPCMIVKGTDFMRTLKDKEEYDLLGIAVEGFCSRIESLVHFNNEVNKAIKYWLGKNGIVMYVLQERWRGNRCLGTWCEVYVQNGPRLIDIVISDDYGNSYILHGEEPKKNE